MTDDQRTIVPEAAFSALADPDRRRLLFALEECDPAETVAIDDAVRGGDRDPETLRVQFRHNHLPRLEAAGFVAQNADADAVGRGSNFDELRPLLDALRRLTQAPERTAV